MHALVVLVLLAPTGNPDPRQLVLDAKSATIEYSRRTGYSHSDRSTEYSYWDIVFSPREIRSIASLLSKAKPYEDDDKWGLYINSYPGHLETGDSRYFLSIDERKTAPYGVVFTLRPVGEPSRRFAYRLAGRDADRFLHILRSSLEERSKRQKPKRVERIAPPPDWVDPFADPSAEKEPAGFTSPHEAWDAYRRARHEGRWRDAYRCLTPESQSHFVPVIVHMGAYLEGTDDKDTARKLSAILKRHGLDVGRIYEETKTLPRDEYVEELNRRARDREGLFQEAMTLMGAVIPQPKGRDESPVVAYGPATNVEILGNEATGRFMKKLDDRTVSEVGGVRQTEVEVEVRFRKIRGRWFCAIDGGY